MCTEHSVIKLGLEKDTFVFVLFYGDVLKNESIGGTNQLTSFSGE